MINKWAISLALALAIVLATFAWQYGGVVITVLAVGMLLQRIFYKRDP